MSTLRVCIHDSVSKLLTSFIEGQKNGQILYENKILAKDELGKTFAEHGILDNTKFVLLNNGSKQEKLLKWVRFTTMLISGENKINLS